MQPVSVIITAFRRPRALSKLMRSLSMQEGVDLEVFVLNNDCKSPLCTGIFSRFGRSTRMLKDIVVLNSSRNLGCSARYGLALLAKYNHILFLDDDVELLSTQFVARMRDCLNSCGDLDIISCWCAKFRDNSFNYYDTQSFCFLNESHGVEEVDLIGPGISMFRKSMLTREICDIPFGFQSVDNVWFSLMPSILQGSRKFYFPSHGAVRFTDNYGKYAMCRDESVIANKENATRELASRGYIRVDEKKKNSH